MNSYQSSTASDSDSSQRKNEKILKKRISLKRNLRKTKVERVLKNSNSSDKIQIQDPFPQTQNFNPEVKNYVQNIMEYVSANQSHSIINENYMQWQTDINIHMRQILIGWLVQVASGLSLKLSTLHLAVLLVDKYCYARNILKRKYQVLGGACLYIAAKYEQITTPRLRRYVEISDKAYTADQLLMMESEILITLSFNIRQKSTLTFFQIKSEQYGISKSVLGLGYFLLEMCLVEFQFCRKKPTYLSLAILYTAMKLKKKKVPKIKIFASRNLVDHDIFSAYVEFVLRLFSIRYLPKFSPIRKRYSSLFSLDGELK